MDLHGATLEAAAASRMLDAAPDGLVVVDEQGSIVFVNRRFAQMTGYRVDELSGQPLRIVLPDSVRDQHRDHEAMFRAGRAARVMGDGRDVEMRIADGTSLPVDVRLASVDIDGAHLVVASIHDVHLRRVGERALRKLMKVLDRGPDAVYVADASTGLIEYANAGATQLLGFDRDELVGRSLDDLGPAGFDGADHRAAPVSPEAERDDEAAILRRSKDGDLIPCDSRRALVLVDDERPKVIVTDRDARSRLALEHLRARRGQLDDLVARVTAALLPEHDLAEIYRCIVDGVAALVDADHASIELETEPGRHFTTVAGTESAAQAHGTQAVRLDAASLAGWTDAGVPVVLADPPSAMPDHLRQVVGGGVVAPFRSPDGCRGLLTAFRRRGRAPFGAADLASVTELANRLSQILEVAEARTVRYRVGVLEERQRIALDLHDTVIQQLLGIGMQLNFDLLHWSDPAARADVAAAVDQLEDAVRSLRSIVFHERDRPLTATPTATIRALASEAARILGHEPEVEIVGPVDDLPLGILEHLAPALREALSNVARHARATATSVAVRVTEAGVVLTVEDDGIGPGSIASRSRAGNGLANLDLRARSVGGTAELVERPTGGSRLTWRAAWPLGVSSTR